MKLLFCLVAFTFTFNFISAQQPATVAPIGNAVVGANASAPAAGAAIAPVAVGATTTKNGTRGGCGGGQHKNHDHSRETRNVIDQHHQAKSDMVVTYAEESKSFHFLLKRSPKAGSGSSDEEKAAKKSAKEAAKKAGTSEPPNKALSDPASNNTTPNSNSKVSSG